MKTKSALRMVHFYTRLAVWLTAFIIFNVIGIAPPSWNIFYLGIAIAWCSASAFRETKSHTILEELQQSARQKQNTTQAIAYRLLKGKPTL